MKKIHRPNVTHDKIKLPVFILPRKLTRIAPISIESKPIVAHLVIKPNAKKNNSNKMSSYNIVYYKHSIWLVFEGFENLINTSRFCMKMTPLTNKKSTKLIFRISIT